MIGWEFLKVQSFLEQGAALAIVTRTPLCFDEYPALDWPTFFHSLHFKSWKADPGPLAQQVIGKWASSSSNVAVFYVFAANGRYLSAAGYETASRVDAATILKTTHGFVGNGKYKLTGNELEMVPDGKKKAEVALVRWERQYELGQWGEILRMVQVGADGKRYELRLTREKGVRNNRGPQTGN